MTTPEDIALRAQALREKAHPPEMEREPSPAGMVMRVAIELIAAVSTGGMIGWFLDSQFGTSPIFFFLCLMLGIVAGYVTIKRVNDAFADALEKSAQTSHETLDK